MKERRKRGSGESFHTFTTGIRGGEGIAEEGKGTASG